MSTPAKKNPHHARSRSSESFSLSENADPNRTTPPPSKPTKTPSRPKAIAVPKERKFIVVAKKASRMEGPKKRQETAYEALRASQDDFFKKDERSGDLEVGPPNAPEPGSTGRVKQLVEAFESILSVSGGAAADADKRRGEISWALPGLQHPLMKTDDLSTASRLSPSSDGNGDRLSWGSGKSSGSGRIRRNSSDCLRASWNKKLRVTSQQPFKLRTEQRGRVKEENFLQKVKEMITDEEKKRIPIAQGLPWTTDEPECLVKPPVKESTEPIDLVLHSDVRAVERAEFDHHVTERLSLAEQMRLERERQQKLEEEEEIRRLRRVLVPKAQPMPYFDRPFVPKRSARPRTIAKEPRFHQARAMKASSWVSLIGS